MSLGFSRVLGRLGAPGMPPFVDDEFLSGRTPGFNPNPGMPLPRRDQSIPPQSMPQDPADMPGPPQPIPDDISTGGDRRVSGMVPYETPEDLRLRMFQERVQHEQPYKPPEPSLGRRIGAALLGAGQGYLQGSGHEMPESAYQQSNRRMLYGDYDMRAAATDREYAQLAKDADLSHDRMQRQTQMAEAEGRNRYYDKKLEIDEEDREARRATAAEQAATNKAYREGLIQDTLAKRRAEQIRLGLRPESEGIEIDPATGESKPRPGWVMHELDEVDPATGSVSKRKYSQQVEVPVPPGLSAAFPDRQTATQREIDSASRMAMASRREDNRMAIAKLATDSQARIANIRVGAMQAMQAGRLSQDAWRTYAQMDQTATREIADITQQADREVVRIMQDPSYAQHRDPKPQEQAVQEVQARAAAQVQQVEQRIAAAQQTFMQGAGSRQAAPAPRVPAVPVPPGAPRSGAPAPAAAPAGPIRLRRDPATGKPVRVQ